MTYNHRRDAILELLKEKNTLYFSEIEEAVSTSAATLRRDIKKMSDNKMIQRFHGGISLIPYVEDEIPIHERQSMDFDHKQDIAKYAASLIRSGDMIFLDSGTTTLAMIDFISETSITVVTNGILHIQKLKEKRINSFLLCGFLRYRSNALLGSETINLIKKFKFDKAFLGSNAIDYNQGLSTTDDHEAALKDATISHSNQVYILADSSKFNRKSLCPIQISDASKILLITDKQQPLLKNFKVMVVSE
ncbi:MAG: DeoR/GlpR family DNA-binding transcription regulator [Erysipelotrichaceae bacterium]